MNSPLLLLDRRLPRELVNMIQGYLYNNIAYEAIREYIYYLEYTQNLYNNFVFTTYIQPNCYCHTLSAKYLRKYDYCEHCCLFENTEYYKLSQYLVCIRENNQMWKIR